MPYKVTLFFEMGKFGWSESLLNSAGDHTTALQRANQLLQVRSPIMAKEVACTYIRVSDIAIKGDSRISIPVAGGVKGMLGLTADAPWNAALVRCDAGALYRRSLWVRGVTDQQVHVSPTGQLVFDHALQQAAWDAFRAEIVNGNWAMQALDKAAPGGLIANATTVAPIVCTSVGNHNLASGDKVTISNGKGMVYINGVWRITKLTDTTFSLNDSDPPALPLYQLATANWRKHVPSVQDIDKCEVIRLVHRQTGRPFDSSRGRRSKRRRVA